MKNAKPQPGAGRLTTAVRLALVTMTVCCLAYPALVWAVGQALWPASADGSLIRDAQGRIVGAEPIGQAFGRPEYFWPRPSAVDYNAAASGGSNLSPASPALRARAQAIIARLGGAGPVPVDLLTASGSGLDPHISLAAAQYQAPRVATARGLPLADVERLVAANAQWSGGEALLNVLRLNLALDGMGK